MSQVNSGDRVRVHYEGRFEDGEVFDSSKGREPMEFVAGGDQLIPGFSNAVIGMQVGETRTVTVPPEEAYGVHDPQQMQRVALEVLPEGVKVGDFLEAHSGEHVFRVKVASIEGDEATLDANHPLAGKTLIFEIELLSVEPGAG